MATSYPGAIDSLPNPTSATLENAAGFEHDIGHSDLGDAIEAIETELGTLPKGTFATVKARLTALTPTIATTAPASPSTNQVWYDSTTTPYVGKVWNGTAWTIFSQTGSGSGVPWAQVTGGTVTEYTKPDGSVMEVHTFTAAGSLTVVAAGYADVLLVGGGGGGSATLAGSGASILAGLAPLAAGANAVTIGAGGVASTSYGLPSTLGPLTTSGRSWGETGNNGVTPFRAGFPSAITGATLDYGQCGLLASPRANRGDGGVVNGNGSAGVVIVAVQKTPPTASGVVASGGTETTFTGDGTNGVLGQGYKVHTFTASGSLIVTTGGVVDSLVISSGSAYVNTLGGNGGRFREGLYLLPTGTVPVVVGASDGAGGGHGNPSSLGSIYASRPALAPGPTDATGAGGTSADWKTGITSAIDGTSRVYGRAHQGTPRANSGDGGSFGVAAAAGVVIVRYRV